MRAPRAAILPVAAVASLELPRGCRLRAPARERSLACSDDTVFIGEQVVGTSSRAAVLSCT